MPDRDPGGMDDPSLLVRDANNRKRLDLDEANFGNLIDVTVKREELRFIELSARRFDAILQHAGIDRVDLIKMDIEGAEMLLLEGAATLFSGRSAPVVIAECSRVLRKMGGLESPAAPDIWHYFRGRGWASFRRDRNKNERGGRFIPVNEPDHIPAGNENLYFVPPNRKIPAKLILSP